MGDYLAQTNQFVKNSLPTKNSFLNSSLAMPSGLVWDVRKRCCHSVIVCGFLVGMFAAFVYRIHYEPIPPRVGGKLVSSIDYPLLSICNNALDNSTVFVVQNCTYIQFPGSSINESICIRNGSNTSVCGEQSLYRFWSPCGRSCVTVNITTPASNAADYFRVYLTLDNSASTSHPYAGAFAYLHPQGTTAFDDNVTNNNAIILETGTYTRIGVMESEIINETVMWPFIGSIKVHYDAIPESANLVLTNSSANTVVDVSFQGFTIGSITVFPIYGISNLAYQISWAGGIISIGIAAIAVVISCCCCCLGTSVLESAAKQKSRNSFLVAGTDEVESNYEPYCGNCKTTLKQIHHRLRPKPKGVHQELQPK
jgi:hypothetical protein